MFTPFHYRLFFVAPKLRTPPPWGKSQRACLIFGALIVEDDQRHAFFTTVRQWVHTSESYLKSCCLIPEGSDEDDMKCRNLKVLFGATSCSRMWPPVTLDKNGSFPHERHVQS